MNPLTDYIPSPEYALYRYDIVQPPKEWRTDFKNPEYIYPDTGVKNLVGAFFFFNSYSQAANTAISAIKRYRDKSIDGIWITKCLVTEPVKLLDLRDSYFCIELLAALDKAGFAVFCDELKTWKGIPFSKLKSVIHPIKEIVLYDTNVVDNEIVNNAIKEMFDVLKIQNYDIGHLFQMLTDYTNGMYFKSMLQKKGYEGYIFNETNALNFIEGSDTLCVFNSTKFQPPCIVNSISTKDIT